MIPSYRHTKFDHITEEINRLSTTLSLSNKYTGRGVIYRLLSCEVTRIVANSRIVSGALRQMWLRGVADLFRPLLAKNQRLRA